jgi:hypothetical protein
MPLQYLRKVRLTCSGSGGTVLINHHGPEEPHDLKIEFDVSKSISSTQNDAEIKIFNLSESSRNAMGKELDEITLEAGYWPPLGSDNTGVIFKGNIRDVQHTRDGPTIVTTVTCGDGDKGVRNATINKSYKKGTKVETVMNDVQSELEKQGVGKGEWKLPDDLPTMKRPYAAVGSAKREMDILSRGFGFYWSIQNGNTEVMPGDDSIGGIINITPESGMINVPTITDNGIKVAVLLNPEIKPGIKVKIESQVLEMNSEGGEYRVGDCRYAGDNREGSMVVFIVAESMKGGKVDEGEKNETVENTQSPEVKVGQEEAGKNKDDLVS